MFFLEDIFDEVFASGADGGFCWPCEELFVVLWTIKSLVTWEYSYGSLYLPGYSAWSVVYLLLLREREYDHTDTKGLVKTTQKSFALGDSTHFI